MRVALATLAIVAAVLTRGPAGASGIIPICGDANNNGDIDESDGVSALRVAAGLPATCPLAVCDVNADGRISLSDGVNILLNGAGKPSIDQCRDVTSTPVPTSAPLAVGP
jgi:hypothetical protein